MKFFVTLFLVNKKKRDKILRDINYRDKFQSILKKV